MKITSFACVGVLALSATSAHSGGWETGRLNSGVLYQDGNYVESSFGSLNYSINGTTQAGVTHGMAKDQNRMSVSGKLAIGDFDIGLTSFSSGAIQMDGQNPAAGLSVVPSADVKVYTQALMVRYKLNDNFSVIGGARQVKLKASSVKTVFATYNVDSTKKTGALYGLAYERPDIALRLEVLRSESISMALTGDAMVASGTLVVPEATTVNFQTGIAKDTLLMASAHKVSWGSGQIKVVAPNPQLTIGSDFSDTTSYSLGLGRKLSEATSASLTYSWEKGAGTTSTSGFTMSNGSQTLSAGVSHKIGDMTISAGLSYTKAGDVTVGPVPTPFGSLSSAYTGNSVKAFGVKVGYSF